MLCKKCHSEKGIEEFEIANVIKGKEYRRKTCKVCRRKDITGRKKKIRDWIDGYKKTLECKVCGEKKTYLLDFHHRDPNEKDGTLGELAAFGWSKERILKEIEKCDVYCANHHRELHWIEKQ
jgi:hypothetical protein